MKRLREGGLFARLFVSYLLVILVGGVTLLSVGLALGPLLLEGHLSSMGLSSHDLAPGTQTMLADLRSSYTQALGGALLWAGVASAGVAGAVSLFVTLQVTRPLERMQRAARRIAAGRYDERLDVGAPGEVGALALSFNEVAAALEASEARRVELIGNVAHEFRTPLASLRGYLEGLEDGLFAPDAETFGATERLLARLERLVTDLSLLSRVEAGREPLNPEQVSLESICLSALSALRPPFTAKGVGLHCRPIPPSLQVLADPARTAQVLTNLLTNALKHTPPGGEVVLWADADAAKATMHVRDTGEGIPKEALPHIFMRFYRADKARGDGGSGIGLTIAKHFVEAQGGTLHAESCVGEGSHFWFTLPRA